MPDNPLVLGLDTSGVKCSVVLWRDNQVLYRQTVTAPNLHSTLLAGLVSAGLKELKVDTGALQLVCVTSGPGSFTGLRIGMAYAKGFCFALQKSLIAVTNFEILADQAQVPEQVTPIFTLIDARREACYLGIFKQNPLELAEYKIVKISELDQHIGAKGCLVVEAQESGAECKISPALKDRLIRVSYEPAGICRLGYLKYQRGEQADLNRLEPLYIQSFAGVL
jgi:tRNA threonylcarbamoyladenosine biosynthesis protein TsaB